MFSNSIRIYNILVLGNVDQKQFCFENKPSLVLTLIQCKIVSLKEFQGWTVAMCLQKY